MHADMYHFQALAHVDTQTQAGTLEDNGNARNCIQTQAGPALNLSPLFTDILQYYLACSPRATNPFQQVRARLVLSVQGQGHGVGRG